MSKHNDIEDVAEEEEPELLSKARINSFLPILAKDGYPFSQSGLLTTARFASSITPDGVCFIVLSI